MPLMRSGRLCCAIHFEFRRFVLFCRHLQFLKKQFIHKYINTYNER
jgi:hypothetical protein